MVFQLLKRGRFNIVPTIMGECHGGGGTSSGAPCAAAEAGPKAGNGRGAGAVGVGAGAGKSKATAPSTTTDTITSAPLAGVPTGHLGPMAANCFAKFAVVGLEGGCGRGRAVVGVVVLG
jgi:hypothetical protein